MAWEIKFSPEAARWYRSLPPKHRRLMGAAIAAARQDGPHADRKHVKRIKSSGYREMHELRSAGTGLRALVAFDNRKQGIVLVGGDKTGQWDRWYEREVPRADGKYGRHLEKSGQRGLRWSSGRGSRSAPSRA